MSQSIANRLGEVEARLSFIMKAMRMKAIVTSGLMDVNGKPIGREIDANMEELFQMSQALPIVTQTEAAPPQLSEKEDGERN